MIVALGVLSMFQLVFLPGLIASQLAKLRGVGNVILVSLALSPIINYLFVLITTTLGLYNQTISLIFFGSEVVFLIYLTYPVLNKTMEQILNYQDIAIFLKKYFNKNNNKNGWFGVFTKVIFGVIFILAVYWIVDYASIYVVQKDSVFRTGDAVFSWDRWAVGWYDNHIPHPTYQYPQLIPTNWSLTYQFVGDSQIKFFAKNFMGLVEIYILLVIFILGMVKRQIGYFLGVVFTAELQRLFGSNGTGYVDSSVAFFALASVACLLIASEEEDDGQNKSVYIYIGAIVAAGAAVTKQGGLWMALAYPFLLFFTRSKNENRNYAYRYIPGILAIFALIIFPWYGYKVYQIQMGQDLPGNGLVELARQDPGKPDRNWKQQIGHSLELIQSRIEYKFVSGNLIVVLLGLLMLSACRDRFYQFVIGLVIIPYALLWALYFSYDLRNFNLVVPLIGLTAGIGLQWLFDNLMTFGLRVLKFTKVVYLLVPILAIFLLPLRYSDTYMINRSIAKQKEVGDPALNKKLYEYQSEYGIDGNILTDWPYLEFLPGLKEHFVHGYSGSPMFLEQFNDPSVGYALLIKEWMSREAIDYVEQKIAQGEMEVIFRDPPYLFVIVCHGACDK